MDDRRALPRPPPAPTSIGAMAGMLLAGGLFFYHLLVLHTIEWEFFAIVAVAAGVKMAVLLWSILTH